MGILNLVVLLVSVSTFLRTGTYEAHAECKSTDDRCLLINNCPTYHQRVKNKEHITNKTFQNELLDRICKPPVKHVKPAYMCCPVKQIECNVDGERGVCLLREQCPNLQSTPESKLLQNPERTHCYEHNQKNYFCCTERSCVLHRTLCGQPASLGPTRPPSALKTCSHNGKQGMVVPEKLCDYEFSPNYIDTKLRTRCCIPEDPDRPIPYPNAVELTKMPCGTLDLLNKIQGGTYAQKGEFPWMAFLVYSGKNFCSGTLIHPWYVLTARHCVNKSLLRVRLGEHNLLEKPSCRDADVSAGLCSEPQEINIAKTIRSDKYDVALLRLSRPAAVDGVMVRPICLPVFANLRMDVPKILTISGWGLTEKRRVPSSILMKAQTPAFSSEEKNCKRPHVICAGGKNHSNHCAGDSGGPYQAQTLFNGSSRFVQYGIISDGSSECNNPQRPSRGVLVGYVIDWILSNMEL